MDVSHTTPTPRSARYLIPFLSTSVAATTRRVMSAKLGMGSKAPGGPFSPAWDIVLDEDVDAERAAGVGAVASAARLSLLSLVLPSTSTRSERAGLKRECDAS